MISRPAKLALSLMGGLMVAAGAVHDLHAQSEKKPAYLIAEVNVIDPAAYKAYQKKAIETLKPYHVRVLASAKPEVKEGAPAQGNILIIAFDSMADAQKWYSSQPYQELVPERQKAANARLYLVEGRSQ